MRGCHTWSVNGGAFAASRTARVATGGSATFLDNDIMSHKLVLTSGPAVKFVGNRAMGHMGASVKVVFTRAGTYRFTTKPGEDYKGITMKTVGEDNVLHLTVTVS
jgi:plastocyanin